MASQQNGYEVDRNVSSISSLIIIPTQLNEVAKSQIANDRYHDQYVHCMLLLVGFLSRVTRS